MKILIKDEFKNDFTTRIAGEKLRKMILAAKGKVTLDFEGVKIASASFFDEGIAKLGLEGWDSEKVKQSITFKNMFNKDLELLKSVSKTRGLYL